VRQFSNTIPTSPAETSTTEGLKAEILPMEGLEADTSPLEGLEDISIQPFVGIANMRRIVKGQYDKLLKDDSDQQYLIFARVGLDELAKIDHTRNSIGKHIRMAHFPDIDLLIVKIPTAPHESAHGI